MTKFKKTLLGVAASMALAAPVANAALINVGGVVWDPDWASVGNIEKDFQVRQDFTQWFSQTADGVGTLNSYNSAVEIGTVIAASNQPPTNNTSSGYYLSGAGEIYQLNDPNRNTVQSSVTGGGANSFCPGCELTYGFGGIRLNKDRSFDLTDSWLRIYVDDTPDFSVPVTGTALANNAVNGILWLDLKITDLQFTSLVSGVGSGFTSGTFKAIGGLAKDNFPNLLSYNGSAYFGSNPTKVDLDSKYSAGGNGATLSDSVPTPVPEPASMALLGMGLAGLGAIRRKQKAAAKSAEA